MSLSRRDKILLTVDDLVAAFLFHDRTGDPELPCDEIELAISSGETTVEEIAHRFHVQLGEGIK